VTEIHRGVGWKLRLEFLYDQALNATPVFDAGSEVNLGASDELDECLARLQLSSGLSCGVDKIFRSHLGLLPLGMKIEKWRQSKGVRKISFARALSSEWAYARMRSGLRTLLFG
jgi:hypothetical protein